MIVVAVLTGFDALEEHFPLLAADWGVATGTVPMALLGISLGGAVGAALAGRAMAMSRVGGIVMVAVGAAALLGAGTVASPAGLIGLALLYGTRQLVLVVADARLQAETTTSSRATVTSLAALAVFVAWAIGGSPLVALPLLGAALTLGIRLSAPRRGR